MTSHDIVIVLNLKTGAKLTHHTTSAVLCTPSRAALLTGRYAVRMGLTGTEAEDSAPVLIYAAGRAGLPENETTVAEAARRSGYRTAAVGKVRESAIEKWRSGNIFNV